MTYTAEQLRECPFCGKRPDLDDQDTLYPSGVGWKWDEELQMRTYHRIGDVPRDQWCWVMHCPTNSGGCGAEVHGDSREEAITKWNRRAHADALEENARLKAAWDASHKQAMKNGAACNEWRDRAERAEAELAETRRDLQFIERWANHHGQKPNITPREVLSMIQHYPPILEITRSYEDGKVPDTPNPWAELAKLRQHAEAMAEGIESSHLEIEQEALAAYRADFPEEK